MIYLCLASGFEEIEALATVDILRRAGLTVQTVGIGGERITGAHGITVLADVADRDLVLQAPRAVVLPGGMPGMTNLLASQTVTDLLKAAQANDAYLCAICASPSVLGLKGYLRGVKATCYPGFEKNLVGALLCDDGVVTDGKCITAKGAGVTQQFAFAIVQALIDEQTAQKLRSEMQCQ
jgi:4-methyl-5(b-hydroxyethyl)-thiazole monophosphate biosynthesis